MGVCMALPWTDIKALIQQSQLWLCGIETNTGHISCVSPGLQGKLGGNACSTLAELFIAESKNNLELKPLKPFQVNLATSGQSIPVLVTLEVIDESNALLICQPCEEFTQNSQKEHDFVSTVSHEFRTPLTSIKGFADTLIRYGGNLPVEQQKRFYQIIKDQADRLIRLVENVLTATRTGKLHQELTYQPIDLAKILDRVIQTVQGKQSTPFDIRVAMPPAGAPKVWADQDKFEQVLLNLVDNAVKYSPSKKPVAVQVQTIDDDIVDIRVIDQGVGISEHHLPKLFSQFSRIDNPLTREVDGTGLGLYITKSLVLEMDGTIDVASKAGEGSTFRVTFPIATPERQAQHQAKLDSDSPDSEPDMPPSPQHGPELIR